MSEQNNPSAAATRNQNQLSTQDQKELDKAVNYASREKMALDGLSDSVEDWGFLRKFWDAKVPQNDKCFYHFIKIFGYSDEREVIANIKVFREFYDKLEGALEEIKKTLKNDGDNENLYRLIHHISQKLSEMIAVAKSKENSTNSSTVRNMVRDFQKKHDEMENVIKGVQCIALKNDLNKATTGWKESIETIKNLQADLTETKTGYNQMKKTVEEVKEQNNMLIMGLNKMLENNEQMKLRQEVLLDEIVRRNAPPN